MTQLQIHDFFKNAFGFERVFNDLERLSKNTSNFPPYNITVDRVKNPNHYLLEMAVAGFSREDITVKIVEDGDIRSLVITGEKAAKDAAQDEPDYLVRMLSARSFKRVFNMADNAEVENVELRNGMLRVTVAVITPTTRNSETVLAIN